VPRRIEIELTSARPDGTWTWRAAGAREPKGVLDGKLLYEGAKAGEVLKADAEFELEGIVIISVTAPRTDKRNDSQRIEIIGPSRDDTPGVTTQLVGRGERRDRRPGDDRRRDKGDRGERSDRGPGRSGEGRPRPDGARTRAEGPPRGDRPRRDGEGPRGDRPRREGDGSRGDTRREGGRREGPGSRPGRTDGERRPSPEHTSSTADRGKKRLNPGQTHRKAVMDSLAPEERPVAEQILRGGIPAVRTALHLEREKAEAEGRPAPSTDALLVLAESLLPRLRAAEWRDRAEAAVAGIDDISMRDLRSVAAGADQARDDETRELASRLHQAIEARVAKMHTDWVSDITSQLEAGRVVRAVRLASRPPDSSARLDDDLTQRLASAAGATMAPGTAPDLWASMLEAVADSPIRRLVAPAGLPAEAPPDLKRAAHQYSGSIPALAKMLGVTIPPPPAPSARRRGDHRPGGPRPSPREARPGEEVGAGAEGPAGANAEAEPAPAGEPQAAEKPAGENGAEAHTATPDADARSTAPETDEPHAAPTSDAPTSDAQTSHQPGDTPQSHQPGDGAEVS
jgi:hypothetical protein